MQKSYEKFSKYVMQCDGIVWGKVMNITIFRRKEDSET